MKAITLRNIPADVQRAIREKARQKRISANKAVIELLEERIGRVASKKKKTVYHDLDHLAGTWTRRQTAEFERTLETLRPIDEDLWK